MPNKSHNNSGLRKLVQQRRDGIEHSTAVHVKDFEKTYHALYTQDAVELLKTLPDSSVQLVLIDPPYNLELETWDKFSNYLEWAKQWLDELYRVMSDNANCVIFGGFQFQDLKQGDLLEVLHYTRHNTKLRLINLIVWYYKNGMSAHRYFANRHEEAIWLSKTKKYYFDLDAVRVPYDEKSKKAALRDKRLIAANIEKGKNPTNVWEIGRLNGNSSERVGHPTQKPKEVIRRFVRALSYEGAVVLDFFAGSGTTGAVCIEENRHSIMVDSDSSLKEYFNKHLQKLDTTSSKPFDVLEQITITDYFNKVRTNSNVLPIRG
ncbi:site-specific DNA-methyltransferase [Hallella sp.]|uniref:DNA-methyltransferase n=1 Tax=Hallella sp. TaxID=2980186 RepID=UPI00307950E0